VTRRLAAALLATLASLPAAAQESRTLRFATAAPDGTAWARQARSFARDVEQRTGGAVKVKWYFGGIAGDETAAFNRVRRGQLDGVAASTTCSSLAPSLRVGGIIGLFQNRDEWRYVITRLRTTYEAELHKEGVIPLGVAGFGIDILLSRKPVHTMRELRNTRLWTWDLDPAKTASLTSMGIPVVPLPIEEADRAYAENKIDGFIATPTAALAFQWSPRAGYFTDLPITYAPACLLLSEHAFDALPYERQKAVRDAAVLLVEQFEEIGHYLDDQLVHGLFEKQGMVKVPLETGFRSEFFEVARQRRATQQAVTPDQLARVLNWLADYRAEHRNDPTN
jgi:TRAP-type C4-dicarboxylate transport system substrate-binding protein